MTSDEGEAYLVTNKGGRVLLFQHKPYRIKEHGIWASSSGVFFFGEFLPQSIVQYAPKWNSEPVLIKITFSL